MTQPLAYRIRGLRHAYDGAPVLDIPRLDIASGQMMAFMGPNGCGKTTLFSILAMLLPPAAGSIWIQGSEIVRYGDRRLRRRVTLVHQKPVLFSTSVRHNIAFGLKALSLPSHAIQDRVHAIAEATGLTDKLDKPARKLSGGEAQRVALARALVLETPILLLDEPTNSLDDASRPILAELLHKANRERNTTVILATHDPDIAAALSCQTLRLERGEILESPGH